MPYECRTDESRRIIIIRVSGVVTGRDILEAKRDQMNSPAFGPGVRVIWDGTGVEQLLLLPSDTQSMRQLVALQQDAGVTGSTAMVAVRTVDRAAAWLFVHIARRAGWTAGVFSSMDEALDYLELRDGDVPAS